MSPSRAAGPGSAAAPDLDGIADADADFDAQATAAFRRQVGNARRVAGQTLASVAQRSGLSTAYISQIESGSANPTLRTIAQLAGGLGCDLAELFGAGAGAGGARFEPRFAPLPLLAETPGHQAIWDVTALGASGLCARLVHGPAGDHAESASHPGEELVVVLAGSCTLRVGTTARPMRPGESCHLAGTDPHSITDTSDDSLLLVVLTEE
jgi:transcriptional regulator with XRE-family HTH domain